MASERAADGASGRSPPRGPDTSATDRSGSRLRRLAARLLRVPLFYKILLANAGAVALASGLGAWLTASRGLGNSGGLSALGVALLIGLAGGLSGALIHVFLLPRALSPLRELAAVASRLKEGGPEGDLRARVPATADRNLAELIRVFNGMLDTMARYRSQLRRLMVRTVEASEAERKLIADRLQEDTAQHLASLMVRLEVVRRTGDPEARDAALDELREELAVTLDSVRRAARQLHPPELGDIGLERALRAFVRTLADGDGRDLPRVDFDLEPVDGDLEEGERLALYRILQEALRNAHAHAEADRVRIELRRDGDLLRAVVKDDGRGFPTEGPRPDEEGLGLLSMRERAIQFGGTFSLSSQPGEGTTVLVELPLLRRL